MSLINMFNDYPGARIYGLITLLSKDQIKKSFIERVDDTLPFCVVKVNLYIFSDLTKVKIMCIVFVY